MFHPMPSRFTPDVPLTAHPVHGLPPSGAPYVWGRWHPGRATFEGLRRECVSLAKTVLGRGADLPERFVIFCRPRSGSTLLTRLMNQVSGVVCGGEVLNKAMVAPRAYLNRTARLSGAQVHGTKLLSYQLLEIQKHCDPERLFASLSDDGFTLIHLKRNTFEQALSLSLAQATGRYHRKPGEPMAELPTTVSLDPAAFVRQYEWNAAMLDYEVQLLSRLPHLTVSYETDLQDSAAHAATVRSLATALGLPAPARVEADMKRIGGPGGVVRARNVDELRNAVRDSLPLQLAV